MMVKDINIKIQEEFENATEAAQYEINNLINYLDFDESLKIFKSNPKKSLKKNSLNNSNKNHLFHSFIPYKADVIGSITERTIPDFIHNQYKEINYPNKTLLYEKFEKRCIEYNDIQIEGEYVKTYLFRDGMYKHLVKYEDKFKKCLSKEHEKLKNNILEKHFNEISKIVVDLEFNIENALLFFDKYTAFYEIDSPETELTDVFNDTFNTWKLYLKICILKDDFKFISQPANISLAYINKNLNYIKKKELFYNIDNYKLPKWYLDIESFLIQNHDILISNKSEEYINNNKDFSKDIKAFTYKKYNSNLPAIKDLLDSLKKNKFVHNETDLKDFRNIFNDTKPSNKIKWTGSITDLSYFVKIIHHELKLIEDLKQNVWKVTFKIFADKDGNDWEKKLKRNTIPARAKDLQNCASKLK